SQGPPQNNKTGANLDNGDEEEDDDERMENHVEAWTAGEGVTTTCQLPPP
ncbi:hypothetical protein A2U01_0102606, partial [Trifolium medium]|nr:hypothetical protein [Trifolium medium]